MCSSVRKDTVRRKPPLPNEPPRRVSMLTKLGVLLARPAVWGGLLVGAIPVMFMLIMLGSVDFESLIYFHGEIEEVEGKVVSSERHVSRDSDGRSSVSWETVCSFVGPNGEEYKTKAFRQMTVGEKCRIEYPAGKPWISRLKGGRVRKFPVYALLFFVPFLAVPAGFIIAGIRRGLQDIRLMKFGESTLINAEANAYFSKRIVREYRGAKREQSVYSVKCSCITADGRTFSFKTDTPDDSVRGANELAALYDPADPTTVLPVDCIPGDYRVDPAGTLVPKKPQLVVLSIAGQAGLLALFAGIVALRFVKAAEYQDMMFGWLFAGTFVSFIIAGLGILRIFKGLSPFRVLLEPWKEQDDAETVVEQEGPALPYLAPAPRTLDLSTAIQAFWPMSAGIALPLVVAAGYFVGTHFFFPFMLLFVFAAIGLVGVVRQGLEVSRLVSRGELAFARLIDEEKHVTRSTGRHGGNTTTYHLTFEYATPDGEMHTHKVKTANPKKLEDDDYELLVYDPARPSKARLLDELPGNASIDPMGNFRIGNPIKAAIAVIFPFVVAAAAMWVQMQYFSGNTK